MAQFQTAINNGAKYVVTLNRDGSANWRTTFKKIIARAGLVPWPKLFPNLRSSRQTELEEGFPSHVVCAWIGNSQKVARKHYLQVTDEHFAKAADSMVAHSVAATVENGLQREERDDANP